MLAELAVSVHCSLHATGTNGSGKSGCCEELQCLVTGGYSVLGADPVIPQIPEGSSRSLRVQLVLSVLRPNH